MSLQNEIKQMKDELLILKRRVTNNSGSRSESLLCQCDISNYTKTFQNFQREVRYISLTFLDLQNASAIDNASNYRFMNKNHSWNNERRFGYTEYLDKYVNCYATRKMQAKIHRCRYSHSNISKDKKGKKYCIFL